MNQVKKKSKFQAQDLTKKAKLLELAGDETRIQILCTLFEHNKICVSDIAGKIQMSIAAISHHLQLMHKYQLISSVREGKNICYSLNKNPLTKYLRQFICHKGSVHK